MLAADHFLRTDAGQRTQACHKPPRQALTARAKHTTPCGACDFTDTCSFTWKNTGINSDSTFQYIKPWLPGGGCTQWNLLPWNAANATLKGNPVAVPTSSGHSTQLCAPPPCRMASPAPLLPDSAPCMCPSGVLAEGPSVCQILRKRQ